MFCANFVLSAKIQSLITKHHCLTCLIDKDTVMGKRGKKKQKGGARPIRCDYKDIIKENKRFEEYYKGQQCIPSEEFDSFMEAMRKPLPVVYRLTGYKSHAKQLLKQMKKNHFQNLDSIDLAGDEMELPHSLPWYPDELAWQTNLTRTQIRKIPQLESFHNFLITETESGHVTRQEAVSMIPPLLLDIQPHHKVLDLCAAPGSKTAQLIERLHSGDENSTEGLCIANDKDNKRCYMLVHQTSRLNSPISMIVNHDAARFPDLVVKDDEGKKSFLKFDRVLADVPCSGDGTMRKNTDVWKKWNVANGVYLHRLQSHILRRGLELLKPGGKIVYSTCSLNPIENEAVVASMLEKCEGALELIDVSTELKGLKRCAGISSWRVLARNNVWLERFSDVPDDDHQIKYSMFPSENPEKVKNMHLERCLRLLPHHQNTGGFFVAVMKKVSVLPWEEARNEKLVEACSHDSAAPPTKKKRWFPGFREDPFVFLDQSDSDISNQIKSFYALKEEFPVENLLTRTEQAKKKHVYLVSPLVRNVIVNNRDSLKVVNSGVRVFTRCDNNQPNLECAFRIVQDGNECILPFMQQRIVNIGIQDSIVMLCEEQPLFSVLSDDVRKQLGDLKPGCLLFKYVYDHTRDGESNVNCDLLMSGWRGNKSARLYMSKFERAHFLNLIGHDVPEIYLPNTNTRRKRADGTDNTENSEVSDVKSESDVVAVESEDITEVKSGCDVVKDEEETNLQNPTIE